MSVPITEKLMYGFQPSKIFKYHKGLPITSLDFDDSGQFLISCGSDQSIQLYDVSKGKHSKATYSKKYGCHLARFTHLEKNCIYASTKEDDTIRYLSLHDNSYIRYFRGHKKQVTALEMSPLDDIFLSASQDDTVRLWDTRTSTCQGLMNVKAPNFIAFDPTGYVVAIANQSTKEIGLYNTKAYSEAPFDTFAGKDYIRDDITKIEFSNDGKRLLVSTTTDHFVLDAFNGALQGSLTGSEPVASKFVTSGQTTMSPDGRFVYGGSNSGVVNVWDLQKVSPHIPLTPEKSLKATEEVPNIVLFNPRLWNLATANRGVTLWLPDFDDTV